jgi:hypothetical protein
MAKDKDSGIDKLKKDKDLKPLPKKEMTKFTGGKKKRRWSKGCGGILPQ